MGNNTDSLKQQIYASMDMKDAHELLAIWESNDHDSWSDETFEAVQAVLRNRGVEIPDLQTMQQSFNLANEYHQNSQNEEALVECNQLIESTPDWSPAHNLRGVILEDLDREEEAIEEYREAIRIDPDNDDAKENLVYAEDYVEAHRDSYEPPEQKNTCSILISYQERCLRTITARKTRQRNLCCYGWYLLISMYRKLTLASKFIVG